MQAEIGEMLTELKPYETAVHTGNDAVDVVLNEKLKICQEKGISCTPGVDGSLFAGMAPLDLCTIFGNALDNAIESCAQIEDAGARVISVRSIRQSGTVLLTFRNTCAHRPDLKNGLPATTKDDRENHGYGLRSIRYLAEKYGGQLFCRVEGEEFVLSLLFPDDGAEA